MDSNKNRNWHKSSYSGNNGGNCVEVADGTETLIRDTQNRELGHLAFNAADFAAFIQTAKADEL